MNRPFTMLLGVKGVECKPMTPQNDVTQTLDRNKSALYKPPQDTAQFVMLQDFWNMRKNEFLTQSITLGSFVRWWSREGNELDLQCGLTWWNEQPDPSPVSPVNIHDLCIAELPAGEMRAEMIVCMSVNNASLMRGATNKSLVGMAWPYMFK